MKSNAPGQLLGFSIQFPRALYHLLKSGPKDVVCVEVLGDVASLTADGQLITEEDNGHGCGGKAEWLNSTLYKSVGMAD